MISILDLLDFQEHLLGIFIAQVTYDSYTVTHNLLLVQMCYESENCQPQTCPAASGRKRRSGRDIEKLSTENEIPG